jgi:hypothetical protein
VHPGAASNAAVAAAIVPSATSAFASQSSTMYATSSAVRCQLTGVSRYPARWQP